MTAEECAAACDGIDDIISRPDPGNACILSDDAGRTDWNIFSGCYGSLSKTEDKIEKIISDLTIKFSKEV